MSGPEFVDTVNAVTALETPQIVLSWSFSDEVTTPLSTSLTWKWLSNIIRRSATRFPEDASEGDLVLSEAYSTDNSVSKSDTDVEALTNYYYSMFFSYEEHSSNPISNVDDDIKRLGSSQSGILRDKNHTIYSGANASTSASATVNIAAATLRASGVEAGHIFQIDDGGADDGFYKILSVNSDTQLTLDTSLTVTSSSVDYVIISNAVRYWISGIDYKRSRCLWRWNTESEMVDYKVDLSDILDSLEPIVSIAHTGIVDSVDSIVVVTNKRVIRLPYELDYPTETDILAQWRFDQVGTNLKAGFYVKGCTYDAALDNIYLLDVNSAEVVVVDVDTGLTLVSTIDLLGLTPVTSSDYLLSGISLNAGSPDKLYVARSNYVYEFNASLTNPTVANVTKLVYTRQQVVSDISVNTDDFTGVTELAIVDDTISKVQTYLLSQGREYLWQQEYVPDADTIGLYSFTDGSLLDKSSFSNTAVNSGAVENEEGRFGGCYEIAAAASFINLNAVSGEFDGDEGSASVWFKSATSDQLTSGTSYISVLENNSSNRVRIGIVSGSLVFEYSAGGTTKTVSVTHPSADTEWHHYLITWSNTDDEMKAYLDGDQQGTTQTALGTFSGSISVARLGGPSSNSSLGCYDECMISKIAREVFDKVILYTSANRMHANSGRSYTATYADRDPLKFAYRDEVFTPKYMGGEYLIRNDYDKSKLHPPDKTISSRDEVIFRDEQPNIGDLGRTTRLLALMLDRISDDRELLKTRFIPKDIDVDLIDDYVSTLGLQGYDTDNWNVDMKRRFISIMPTIHSRGGRKDSYSILARLLGFYATAYTLVARRRWDSVVYSTVNPIIQPIYLDQMGSMDTYYDTFPLALLRFLFYKLSKKSSTGVTSTSINRLLTDTNGEFLTTVSVGSLIVIAQGQGDAGDSLGEAEYLVTEVHSDTQLKVDKNWVQGSNTNVTYYNNWRIPNPDPYAEYLVTRFLDIAPDSMRVEVLDEDDVL